MPEETLPEQREEGVEYILDADVWEGEAGTWPAFNHAQLPLMGECGAELKFLFMPYMAQTDEVIACLKCIPKLWLFLRAIIRTVWVSTVHWCINS